MIRPVIISLMALALSTTACAQAQVGPATTAAPRAAPASDALAAVRARLPEDEIIYFVLPDRFDNGDVRNDRGGLSGNRLQTGFDPTHTGFYHGGDLAGLTRRLDYIQSLGVTAIWFAPIFRNKPVQGGPGEESAGYHGYWVTDFTTVDPHFGTEAEFRAFVDAAHARGMKVYMDIIANHTADVIQYREQGDYSYRSKADYPFSRRGGVKGAAINPGFNGDGDPRPGNWAKLTDPSFAYTPFVPKGEEKAKVPAWLNDPQYYHNRGNTTFFGEDSVMGDFVGLDDLATEDPRVIAGFIDIYASWIDRFGIDGFRIDTARHVNPEFWQAFNPAILERARAAGIPNFTIFGEVAIEDPDPGSIARFTRVDRYPAVLDFAFQATVRATMAGSESPALFDRLFAGDALYEGGAATARTLPTFTGNHDMGRFTTFVRQANPQAGEAEMLARTRLANAMMFALRGVPTIYYGDEQGFVGDGNDQGAREDMFASRVASYNDNDLIGTDSTTAQANFNQAHPLYRQVAELAAIRRAHPALTRGRQVTRNYGRNAGIVAFSRFDPTTNREIVAIFNTSNAAVTQNVIVERTSARFTSLTGPCPDAARVPGSITITLPAFGYALCQAEAAQ